MNKLLLITISILLSLTIVNADSTKEESQNNQNINTNKQVSFNARGVKITNINDNKTTIDIGNLTIGQSGIVIHIYEDDKRSIVANAQVIESNETSSIIEFSKFDDLKQDAIPTSSRTVEKGDILVLNYLYTSSLLIAPNVDTFQAIRTNFKFNNFLHSDIFATKLKIDNMPYITKEYLQSYAIEQNLGTIFIVVNQNLYVLDTKTFKIIGNYKISYDENKAELPFYTRVTDIETSTFDIQLFSNREDLSYDEYYKKLLGL